MVKQTVKSVLIQLFLLCVSMPYIFSQTDISSDNILVEVDYQFDDSCFYQLSDSVRIIFQKGFEGKIEMMKSGKTQDTFFAYYNKSLEMVPHIFIVSNEDLDNVNFLFDNRESVKLDIAENFGVLYINRNDSKIVDKTIWSFSYNNCFFPARR